MTTNAKAGRQPGSANQHPSSPQRTQRELEGKDPIAAALAAMLRPIVVDAVRDALAEHSAADAPAPQLLTVEQACAALQCSRAKLHRLRGEGLPVIMLGDSVRVRLADAVAWLEQRSGDRNREQST